MQLSHRDLGRHRWVKYLVLALICLPILLLAEQMYRFGRVCFQSYQQSKTALSRLPHEVLPKEAIVVLTGDRKRIPKALELLRLRGSPLLIISGAARGITLTDLVNQQGDAALRIHEVWGKILLESRSSSTIENAHETGQIVKERGLKRLILVTSEYHMPRAAAIFHRVLPWEEIVEYPVASDVSHINFDFSSRSINGLWLFWWEFLKNRLYRIYTSHYVSAAAEK